MGTYEEERKKRYDTQRETWLLRQSGKQQKWKLRIKKTNGEWETRKFTGDRTGARDRLIEILNSRDNYEHGWIILESL